VASLERALTASNRAAARAIAFRDRRSIDVNPINWRKYFLTPALYVVLLDRAIDVPGGAMIGAASLASILLGGALSYAADRVPARIEILESGGGALLLAGLALLGSGLPFVP
jgi:hypothetical protein